MSQPEEKFISKAVSHWTKERLAKITHGKPYIILPSTAPLLLRELGILNADATISRDAMRKFVQINHFALMIQDDLKDLRQRFKEIRIVDFGCGKGYFTFLLAWLFQNHWRHPVQIIGVDSEEKRIAKIKAISEKLGFGQILTFQHSSISSFEDLGRVHLMVALHACDTATDDALAFAVRKEVDVIAVAPCCQAELAAKWKELEAREYPLRAVFESPHFRRDVAASMTDVMRMELLRGRGYEVTAKEFVSSEHTPKNRLMLAIRRGNYLTERLLAYAKLKQHLGGVSIRLEELLQDL